MLPLLECAELSLAAPAGGARGISVAADVADVADVVTAADVAGVGLWCARERFAVAE